MAGKAIQSETLSDTLIDRWGQVGQKLVMLAEAIPEDKLDYRPVPGVRTFGEVLRHVAFWNGYVRDRASGGRGDDATNELPKDRYFSKKQIVDALKESTAEAVAALNRHEPELSAEIAEMLVTFIEHNCEHYGQLVVYVRLNGIVPPASRG
jgi:uncharacterized damage-inducible protein DinB